MSEYLRGVDISQYYPGQVSKLCEYFFNQGTPLNVAQVELTCGTTIELTTNQCIIDVIKDIKSNNLKLGYYAYIYPYAGEGSATLSEQGEALANAYNQVKKNLNITPDCKIMIDIEKEAFQLFDITPTPSLINEMVTEFVSRVDSILGKQEYVVYSSRAGINEFFSEIDISTYGLIVSAPTLTNAPMTVIKYPLTDYTISEYESNWGNNWTGVQFAFGIEEDYDIYTKDILIKNNSLTVGDYVKLLDTSKNFAPNLIPSSDKDVNYVIESINGSMCKLSKINKWVDFEFLELVSEKRSSIPSSLPHPKGSNEAATQIYNLCKSAGWSTEAICGMLGNLSWESYLNPTEWQGGGGGGYGLAQWPLATLQEYAQQAGVSDYNTIQGQIDIIIYQMKYDPGEQYFENYNYPDFWIPANEFVISTKSPSFLAQAWLHNYERARVACTHSRVEGAEYWYDYFS